MIDFHSDSNAREAPSMSQRLLLNHSDLPAVATIFDALHPGSDESSP
jgi:hypothetical protein